MGQTRQRAHDDRYDAADEFLDVVYKLWQESWDDGAVMADKANGIYADPVRVRRIVHHGANYDVDAIHLSEPSPQRTPVLFQAGSSSKGRDFAARHAECVFVSGPSAKVISPRVAAIRAAALPYGRERDAIKVFSLMTVVIGATEAEAQAKLAEQRALASPEGGLVLMAGWTGVDFSQFDLDDEVRHVENDAGRTAMDNITRADPSRRWTVREVGHHVALGGIGPLVVGTPSQVADTLEAWVDETDVDGFNLAFTTMPGSFVDIVDHLVPELQRRGRYKRDYADGTLRHKLFRRGARLAPPHPGSRVDVESDHPPSRVVTAGRR